MDDRLALMIDNNPCPECKAEIPPGDTICPSCGWDATTTLARPPRPSFWAILRGGAWRLMVYGAIVILPIVGFMRLRATGPGPDLETTARWMVMGDHGRAEELVSIHRAHEIAVAAARYAVDQLNPPPMDGDWAALLEPYATMYVRGWMPLLFYGATSDMAPSGVRTFYEIRAVDGWGRPYRVSSRVLLRDDGWSDDEQVVSDLNDGIQSSFYGPVLTELDQDRDWMRLEIRSAGSDASFDSPDDLVFISYFPVGLTLRLRGDQQALEREMSRAYTTGRQYFRVEGSPWDLIDARLLAEFRLEYLP